MLSNSWFMRFAWRVMVLHDGLDDTDTLLTSQPFYCRNPRATAEAFRNGWLHTGDVVRRDGQGRLYYLSRMKDMIRRSGENIAAAEVEDVIMRHPGVRLAAVIAVADDLRGVRGAGIRGARRVRIAGRSGPGDPERVLRRAARTVQGAALLEVPRRSAAHSVGTRPQGRPARRTR